MVVATSHKAWHARAKELARWALPRLVNRPDCYFAHVPAKRKAPATTRPVLGRVTEDLLAKHFAAVSLRDLVMLPAMCDSVTSRWLCIHTYSHGEDDTARPGDNFHASLEWYDKLTQVGGFPMLEEVNPGGAYRLWVFFDSPMDSVVLTRTLSKFVSDYADMGLYHEPTLWPPTHPQTDPAHYATEPPGRTPSFDGANTGDLTLCYSRVWSGSEWLEGDEAISAMLATPLTPDTIFRKPRRNMTPVSPAASVASLKPVAPPPAVPVPVTPRQETPAVATPTPTPANSAVAAVVPKASSTSETPSVEALVRVIAERTGMREEEVVRRAMRWVHEQDEVVQAVILGQVPKAIAPNVWPLIVKANT